MAENYHKTRIQVRRGTAAEFSAANPVLGAGEPAFETDTNVLKVGDGSTAYNSLSAISGGGGSGISNLVEDTTPQLGGNLDLNSNNITGTGDIDVAGTVTSTDFIGPLNGAIRFTCKMIGSDGKKGQVVYISGLSGDTSEVSLARSDSASTMPAFGILAGNISQNGTGEVVTFGSLRELDADDFVETGITLAENDVLYVSSSEAGTITNVKPSGQSNLIQNIGKCIRHTPTTNMTFKVGGAGRANDVPNLNEDQFFLGNSSNQAAITDFGDAVGALTANFVSSDTTSITGASGVNNIVTISQTDYDALGTYDPNTIYYIV